MNLKSELVAGLKAGLVMGAALFLAGAVFSGIIYGPQFAPAGKFEPSQLNPFYFIWTKLVIGAFFGLLFALLYTRLPLERRITSMRQGVLYGFLAWVAIWLWNISHPLVYGSIMDKDQLFWLLYSLSGFIALGAGYGRFRCRLIVRK